MQTADLIAAIGSIATAIATLIALIALYITIHNYRQDLRRQQAAQIRQNLRTLINQSYSLKTLLTDGSTLIYGSSAITRELRSRLSPSADSKEFWGYVRGDDHLLLSVAVVGWYSSSQTMLLGNLVNQIEQCVLSLSGKLIILSYPVQMLGVIVNDACSPVIFQQIFSAEGKTHTFFQEHEKERSIDKLINALTLELQGNSALYFSIRYLNAVNQVNDFIKELSDTLLDLEDSKLIRISKIESKDALAQPTRTGSMKVVLEELKSNFPTEKHNRLLGMVNEIEKAVSKEQAAKNLEDKPLDVPEVP